MPQKIGHVEYLYNKLREVEKERDEYYKKFKSIRIELRKLRKELKSKNEESK